MKKAFIIILVMTLIVPPLLFFLFTWFISSDLSASKDEIRFKEALHAEISKGNTSFLLSDLTPLKWEEVCAGYSSDAIYGQRNRRAGIDGHAWNLALISNQAKDITFFLIRDSKFAMLDAEIFGKCFKGNVRLQIKESCPNRFNNSCFYISEEE